MSDGSQIDIWERNQNRPPPPALSDHLTGDERLLWSATLPSKRLQVRWQSGVLICLGVAALSLHDVWGQTMTEYCGANRSSRCNYPVAWLLILFCSSFAAYLLHLVWRNKSAPWSYFYGISTKRALLTNSHNPRVVYCAQLDQQRAGIDWFSSVRFGRFRTGFAFSGLGKPDALRAVYWANEGRFQSERPNGAKA